jgi:hypothetical protein
LSFTVTHANAALGHRQSPGALLGQQLDGFLPAFKAASRATQSLLLFGLARAALLGAAPVNEQRDHKE